MWLTKVKPLLHAWVLLLQASRQKLDARRFSEVVEDFRELALGKLSAVKICMDLNTVIGGACESLHDWPVG